MNAIKLILTSAVAFLLLVGFSYAKCTPEQEQKLKQSGYTEKEIYDLCQTCTSDDIKSQSFFGKTKQDIISYCKSGANEIDRIKKEEKIPLYRMLLLKPITITFDTSITNKVLREEKKLEGLSVDKSSKNIRELSLRYELPLSTIYYIAWETPKKNPHFLLKGIKLYVEGKYGNTASTSDDSPIPIEIDKTTSYQYGINISVNLDSFVTDSKHATSDKY